jgi:ribosomal protein L25 (general stress protein Ctc)
MAKQVKLKAEPRTNVGRSSVSKLRARGIIPAVIYGGKVKSQALQVSARDINAMPIRDVILFPLLRPKK